LSVETIVPNYFEIIHNHSKLFIKIHMFADEKSKSKIHFNSRNILVDYLKRGLVIAKTCNFVSKLCDLGHNFSKGKCTFLRLSLFKIFDNGFNKIGRFWLFERIERLHEIFWFIIISWWISLPINSMNSLSLVLIQYNKIWYIINPLKPLKYK